MENPQRLVTTSKGLFAIPHLPELLQAQLSYRHRRLLWVKQRQLSDVDAVVAWGKKPSALAAEHMAERLSVPLLRIEDAFLRSLALGMNDMPLGVVVDDKGIYYDATRPSRLEELIRKPLSGAQRARAEQLIVKWRELRLSKYNHCRDHNVDYGRPFILLVDQTFGDASIRYGQADSDAFDRMLTAARERYPRHLIVIKTHPDVIAGHKQGHFDAQQLSADPSVHLEGRAFHPPDVIAAADAVFCVTSQMGFEALLWQKPVYVFGAPFYAGWGLTHDMQELSPTLTNRRGPAMLEQLAHAAFIDYARYWHPEQQRRCSVEELMDWLSQQREWRQQFPVTLLAERSPRWKRAYLRRYFAGSELRFLKRHAELPEDQPVVVWGRPGSANHIAVEDGFVRSVGLGADLVAPKSWVIDEIGMYYDATRPSKLERLLREAEFSEKELQRAAKIRARLVKEQVSKYNVGISQWRRPTGRQKVILVPGQVESDASITYGSPYLRTNYALLKAVRERCPDDYIVYKPHPDVVAGLRTKDSQHAEQLTFCDDVVLHENMASLLTKVDEVHTLTSLTGFEALLRGVPVTCYGQPFYSGWGLTTDIYPNERRQVARQLDELVAATLIRYPRYLSENSNTLTTIEQALNEIADLRERQSHDAQATWMVKIKRVLLRLKRF